MAAEQAIVITGAGPVRLVAASTLETEGRTLRRVGLRP